MSTMIEGVRMVGVGQGPAFWVMGTALVICKATAEQTGGGYSLFEVWDQPGSGPPMHRHAGEDEAVFILEGTYEIHTPGAAPLRATPGCHVQVARGIVHTYRCLGPERGRMIVVSTPGGLDRFFAELGEPAQDLDRPPTPTGPPNMERVVAICQRHGIEIVGPPPA